MRSQSRSGVGTQPGRQYKRSRCRSGRPVAAAMRRATVVLPEPPGPITRTLRTFEVGLAAAQRIARKPATGSHPKLPEVVIKVLVLEHTPAPSGNAAKDSARGPVSHGSAIREALNQIAQAVHVCVPRRRARGQKLRRALALPFRPWQHVDHQPVEGRVGQGPARRSGFKLPEALAKPATYVADHLRDREASPERFPIRG